MTIEERTKQETEQTDYSERMAIRFAERGLRADDAIKLKEKRKTVHGILFDPSPHNDDDRILFVRNIADNTITSSGDSGKPAGWGLPGGGMEIIFDVTGEHNLPTLKGHTYFTEAYFDALGAELLTLGNQALDKTDRRLNDVIREYDFGSKLSLTARINEEERLFSITPTREETLAETVRREVFGECGVFVKLMSFGRRKREWVAVDESSDRNHYNFVVPVKFDDMSVSEPTEIAEIDKRRWVSLQNPVMNIWDGMPDTLAYFKHIKRIRNAVGTMNEISRGFIDDTDSYHHIPFWSFHESWHYTNKVLGRKNLRGGATWYPLMKWMTKKGIKIITDANQLKEVFGDIDKFFGQQETAGQTPPTEEKSRATEPTISPMPTENGAALLPEQEQYDERAIWESWLKKP